MWSHLSVLQRANMNTDELRNGEVIHVGSPLLSWGKDHRIVWMGMEGTSAGHLVWDPCSSSARLITIKNWLLKHRSRAPEEVAKVPLAYLTGVAFFSLCVGFFSYYYYEIIVTGLFTSNQTETKLKFACANVQQNGNLCPRGLEL